MYSRLILLFNKFEPDHARQGRFMSRLLSLERLETRTLMTLQGNQLFPADNPWNEKITSAPVAANSNTLVASIGAASPLHPDFGTVYNGALIGIPYNVVPGTQPKVNVVIDAYADESDLVPVPIPTAAVIEGDPLGPAQNNTDRHLIVYDKDHNFAYELFNVHRPAEEPDNQWHADSEAVWDMSKDSFRPAGFTSADAAGLPILPGLVRPDEVLDQGVINHALRFTVPRSDSAYIFPASHDAGTNNPAYPRMGERFRLKQSFDISRFPAPDRVILQALKDYGMIVADNGSSWYLSGEPSSRWNDDDLHALTSVLGSNFEAVNLSPIVSSLDQTSGSSGGGTSVTIHGQNFSGTAGQLQVLFGVTPASQASVTVISDTVLVVTSPAHTAGTVDVTVQTPYGTSTTSASDHFAFTPGSAVTGRNLFYYNSPQYDTTGNPQAPLAFSDDNAIATDKAAYLPSNTVQSTYANISNYDAGINGIMVDLKGGGTHSAIASNFTANHNSITNDFTFKMGNNNSPGSWAAAPLPTAVLVRTGMTPAVNGAGTVSGSDRIELIWANSAIQQKWIEVIVKATADTGLAANDVFFFGNEIGNTGNHNTATMATTGTGDIGDVVNHGANNKNNVAIISLYDSNKDGLVGTSDISDTVNHGTNSKNGLVFINIGSSGPFAPESVPAAIAQLKSSDADLASALARPASSQLPSLPAVPSWIVNRLGQLDLNHGLIAKYLTQLAHNTMAKAKTILSETEDVSDSRNVDDELLNSLAVLDVEAFGGSF